MYIFKNAWTSIKRNKGRNILIGIIIIVISCACTVTLAIRNTANELINSYEDAYVAEATIGFNRNNMMNNFDPKDEESREEMKSEFSNLETLSLDEVISYADSDYVSSYYYTLSSNMTSDDIEVVTSEMEQNGGDRRFGNMNNNSSFTLTGYSSVSAMSEFIEGSYSITESDEELWDKIFTGNYVLINQELADLNDLSINDTITLIDNGDNEYEFTILGIYEEKSEESFNMREGMSLFSNSANTIITNSDVLSDVSGINISPTYVLTSFDVVDSFQEELYSKGMSEYFTVTTNASEVESATSSISNVSSFSLTFLIITLLIGSIILFVINLVNVRERKYEIGVLRTIGMKKRSVAMQFMLELLIVATASLLLGAAVGSFASKPISNSLLQSEIESSTSARETINENFGGNMPEVNGEKDKPQGMVNVTAFDSIDAVVDFKVVAELLGIGIILTIISSAASMIVIERFSPLQILKERS